MPGGSRSRSVIDKVCRCVCRLASGGRARSGSRRGASSDVVVGICCEVDEGVGDGEDLLVVVRLVSRAAQRMIAFASQLPQRIRRASGCSGTRRSRGFRKVAPAGRIAGGEGVAMLVQRVEQQSLEFRVSSCPAWTRRRNSSGYLLGVVLPLGARS